MALAAGLIGQSAHAQQCSPTLGIDFVGLPPDTVFAVGQSFDVQATIGAVSVPVGGNMTITTLRLALDCEHGTGCDPTCVDEGQIIAYQGDASLELFCPGIAVTSNLPAGGTVPNIIVFTFNPPVVLTANESCTLQFGLTINSIGEDRTPKLINSRLSFAGDCSGTTLDASVCGTFEINLVAPDIEITKVACPNLVCDTGGLVAYTYAVTTGPGNAPISDVVVTDDHCGPGGPNTPLPLQGGDDGDNILEPGEIWTYECSALVASLTTNTATVTGDYVNAVGEVPVTDSDTAVVDVVTINETPGVCSTSYVAKTGSCTGESCAWTGPGEYTNNNCSITLGAGNLSGEYCVTVTCQGTESECEGSQPNSATCCIQFEQPEIPVVDVTGESICAGDPIPKICATVTGGRPGKDGYTVQWFLDSATAGCSPTGAVLHTDTGVGDGGVSCFTPPGAGTYVAVATDTNGCVGQDCGSLISNPSRVVNAENVTVCEDELPANLCATASGGTGPDYDITWYLPDGVTQIGFCNDWSIGDAPCCVLRNTEGVYVVKVVDSAGCTDEDTATLTINPNPTCSVEPQESCNPNVVLTATGFGECSGPFTFAWTKNDAPIEGGSNGVLVANGVGTYCAVVTCSSTLCVGETPCCATVGEAPPCTFFCIDDACVGDVEEFCGPAGFDIYNWTLEGACVATSETNEVCVTVSFPFPGECNVFLEVESEDGCSRECTEDITVYENRACSIEGPDKGCKGDSKLYCGPSDAIGYTWMTSGQCLIEGSPNFQCAIVTYTGNGNCRVSLHVNGAGGCGSDCYVDVQVCPCPVCVEITKPEYDPDCGSSGNELTADVIDLSPTSQMKWEITYGPCLITDGKYAQTVVYTIGADPETEVSCGFKFTVGEPQSCAPTSKCHIDVTCMPEVCGEGCAIGFWKKARHFGFWQEYVADESCGVPSSFCSVFSCSTNAAQTAFGGKSLLQVLQQPGNGLKALGRQAAAALLNASNGDVEYALSAPHVIDIVNSAIESNDLAVYAQVKGQLAALNQQYCPIYGDSFCADLDFDGAVNHSDFNMLLNNWGHAGAGDLDNNGIVGPRDLMILLSCWGTN